MRLAVVVAVLTLATVTSGCVYSEVGGALYMDVKGPIQTTAEPGGSKAGKACSTTVFGLIAFGDASIERARKNGGVIKVSSVDHTSNNIIGYGWFCTIVTGE